MTHALIHAAQGTELQSMSERVLATVAEQEGITPDRLDECLYEVIDPDALDDIFRRSLDATVEFSYLGYHVVVHADGRIDLCDDDA